jgi:rhamnulose-1-phosphate aldolase
VHALGIWSGATLLDAVGVPYLLRDVLAMSSNVLQAAPNAAEILSELGEAGRRLSEIGASEGAAGNLSVYLSPAVPRHDGFCRSEVIELPLAVPELRGGQFIVTGSGTRSRDIQRAPLACLGWLVVNQDGHTGTLYWAENRQFTRLTSEFNSHLAVHRDQVQRNALTFHALVHGQPRRITYLSHLEAYQDQAWLTRRLLRWQPEGILNFPEGIATVPFLVPGQAELMQANQRALHDCRVVVWSKHGVMARSPRSVMAAIDLIEYVETAAYYEVLDRMLGGTAVGLSSDEIRAVAQAYAVHQVLF